MTNRRRFLAGLAALPLSAAARSPDATASPAGGAVPCPEPTPGLVVNPSGSVGQAALTDLVDAYSQVDGVDWQHQLFSVLTNRPDACTHFRQNQVVADEQWLIVSQIAYRSDRQPAPFATGTYQIGAAVTDADGTLRLVAATYQPHGPSCSDRGQRGATGGTVTYAIVTDSLVEGSYDLQFRSDRVQGGFSAPMCTLCAPRPTSRTCLEAPA
ncbi:MAG TPA: hypothetical protein VGM21_06105 [Actinomycetota bacterium]